MLKILLVCPIQDQQTGIYLHSSLINLGCKVAYFDFRAMMEQHGQDTMNNELINAVKRLDPDLIVVCKGLGIKTETIKAIKEFHKKPIVNWIFDVTLAGTYIKDCAPYVEYIKQFDRFYTIDYDAVQELKNLGVNAEWCPEGCFPKMHGEQVINSIQKRRYGADVVFIGSIGSIHSGRDKLLERIYNEGINLKIYGEVLYPKGEEPDWVKKCHTGYAAINDMHSVICQSSKIVLGIDGWPHRARSWSARLYRVLCCGGFYLTTHTEKITDYFKLGEHLDTFKNEDEMIEKILYWLDNDNLRESVAKQGQLEVINKWTFEHSFKSMFKDLGLKCEQ